MRSLVVSMPHGKWFGNGARGSTRDDCQALMNSLAPVGRGLFPPEVVVQVRALACELPYTFGVPLSRWSTTDLASQVCQTGLVASISGATVWRWLNEDAIRPWQYRCWIFPRDPDFSEKAGRILDLYERLWDGKQLQDDEFVVSADEKTSIQARRPRHSSLPTQPGYAMKVEHEYTRCGAWAYLAALDVHRARPFGRSERKTGIKPLGRLIEDVMTQHPYDTARQGKEVNDKCVDTSTGWWPACSG